jgi:hypothetical protein
MFISKIIIISKMDQPQDLNIYKLRLYNACVAKDRDDINILLSLHQISNHGYIFVPQKTVTIATEVLYTLLENSLETEAKEFWDILMLTSHDISSLSVPVKNLLFEHIYHLQTGHIYLRYTWLFTSDFNCKSFEYIDDGLRIDAVMYFLEVLIRHYDDPNITKIIMNNLHMVIYNAPLIGQIIDVLQLCIKHNIPNFNSVIDETISLHNLDSNLITAITKFLIRNHISPTRLLVITILKYHITEALELLVQNEVDIKGITLQIHPTEQISKLTNLIEKSGIILADYLRITMGEDNTKN